MKKGLLLTIVVLALGVFTFLYSNRLQTESFSYPGNNLEIELNLKKGNLNAQSSAENVVSGTVNFQGQKPRIALNNNVLTLIDSPAIVKDISLRLPSTVALQKLTVNIAAGNILLPLREVSIQNVSVNAGASNIELTLPGSVSSVINMSVAAGNIKVLVPKNEKLGGVKIVPAVGSSLGTGDWSGFKKVGESYESEGFEKMQVKSTINLSAGATNFSIDTVD